MKSVMFSEIVHARRAAGLWGRLSPLTAYALSAAIAMPLLVLALRSYDPGVPLAAIVLPMLAGLALPLCAGTPGRLDVSTRFDACHMRHALDSALGTLGYVQTVGSPDRLLYVRRAPASWRVRASVHIRVHAHTLEVVGPIPTLHALQAALAGAAATRSPLPADTAVPALPSRETVAGAMQISDNAGRVAGMAE